MDRTTLYRKSNSIHNDKQYLIPIFDGYVGKGITDDYTFTNRVTSHVSEYVREDGFKLIFERLIMPSMNAISLSKALSRSVTGSMNDLELQAKTILCGGTVSPWDASEKLNEIPFSYIKYRRPRDMFPAMSI